MDAILSAMDAMRQRPQVVSHGLLPPAPEDIFLRRLVFVGVYSYDTRRNLCAELISDNSDMLPVVAQRDWPIWYAK
jgi:hypothetical protein